MKELRVKAAEGRMVRDYGAMASGIGRFVGYTLNRETGEHERNDEEKLVRQTDPAFGNYLKALRNGDLAPADAATAKLAGVDFKE